ncbi:ABC transporter ATP-binding protein [Streptomyces sp. TRM 70351]|uniref:ABC transporter ATP-binding protein n=1 Tax=Streptomyces sp. TRM 70351 TaxID=3116552 RepID=UPI002E7AB912|nr:ABC transporter ATP-binding protein [Streptomyces sp. TRM 70351]MEE1929190.1 ABC transporter ATP-binding protein [Streptomyces sp. TRM 70351]
MSGPGTPGPGAPAPVIAFHGVGLTYPGPPPLTALHPFDLTLDAGEYLTVTGPSGSGKSTFLNIVGLLQAPTAGRYLLDGIDTGPLGDAGLTALRGGRIGFVFQAFHLLPHRTAEDNVTLALLHAGLPRRERAATAREALHRVGLAHRADALPTRLSGGERQRVAIARALAVRPSLLLCDEPTGNLDSGNARQVMALLDDLSAQGQTLLVVTHDPEVARRGGRALALHDGVATCGEVAR